MRLYSPDGSEIVCDKAQSALLLDAGYTKELPVVKEVEESPEVEEYPKSKKITIKKPA